MGKNHIRVAQVSPGLVETEFAFAMNPANPEKAEKLYSSMNCIKVTPIYNVKSDSYLAKTFTLRVTWSGPYARIVLTEGEGSLQLTASLQVGPMY